MTMKNEISRPSLSEHTVPIKWQTIFNAIGQPAIILDRDHRVVAANTASSRLTGVSNAEIVGKYCYEVFHYRTTGAPDGCPMEKMLQSGVMESYDMEIEALNGTFLVSCTPIPAADGSPDKVIHIATDITARKEMELILAAEAAFNRSIIDIAPEGLCVCHAIAEFPYVQFTVWNDRMTEITGYTMEEINDGGYYQTLYPDQELQARAVERMERMRKGENLVGENWRITGKTGQERIVAIWTSVLQPDNGTDHVLAFFIDVTEHKKIEEQHDQSRQDWEDTFNSINDAITILDSDYNIVRANRASAELLGAPPPSLTDQKCYRLFHGLDHPLSHCPSCTVMTGDQPSCSEFFEPHLGKYLELKAFPRIDNNGRRNGIIHVVRDISERKQAEAALREQQNFTNNLIRYSMSAMFVLDSSHTIAVWNNPCENLTGLSHGEMIGSRDQWKAFYTSPQPTLADVILDGDFSRLSKKFSHVSKTAHIPDGYKAEGWFDQINGKDRYLMVEASPVFDSQGKMTHVIESINDMTENKMLEEQLLHAQKMESVGVLAGGIAHEFNNILAVILGYGQIMRDGFEPDSTGLKDLEQILTAADRAAVLTKGLLAFSRKQHVTLKNIDVSTVVRTTLKSFCRIMGDDIVIQEHLEPAPLTIYADQALVAQVIMNLMANARDAMPQGGIFDISSRRSDFPAPYATSFSLIPAGAYAQISLSDSGHGMDDETIARIFEPFFTTKDIGKGTGLGLSVVFGIISQHNGFINVVSEPGKGTTFDLYFPLIEQAASHNVPVEHRGNLRGGDETILLADDELTLLTLLQNVLSDLGYRVITAVDGVDAVRKFETARDEIKLVVLDVQMRNKSGLQAYREMKTLKPHCRALFISGYNIEQFQGEMALDADTELLMKPFAPTDLAVKVRTMLDEIK